MKYIITGATSFIGIELIKLLLSEGHSVIAVCRPKSKGIGKIPDGVTIVTSEMSEYGNLSNEIKQADIFVNLAWDGTGHSGRNDADVQKDNVANTMAAIFAAEEIGCKLFVESGSQAEYGSTMNAQTEDMECIPFSEYGKAKLEVKRMGFELSEKLNIKYMHLRIFSIYGENDHPWTLVMSTLDKMLSNLQVNLSPCTQNWNFVYVKDAVNIIMRLCSEAMNDLNFKHEVYNIASEDTRHLKEFVEEMKNIAGSTSTLNYGAVVPNKLVSLQPSIKKTLNTIGDMKFIPFKQGVNIIIDDMKRQRIRLGGGKKVL